MLEVLHGDSLCVDLCLLKQLGFTLKEFVTAVLNLARVFLIGLSAKYLLAL